MRYLSLAEVLDLYWRLMAQSGGSAGLRDLAALESALSRNRAWHSAIPIFMRVLKKRRSSVLRRHRQAGFAAGDANFISTMKNTLESKVKQALSSASGADDDLMKEDNYRAARRIVLSGKAVELAIVTFKGGGGQYNVRYAQAYIA